MKLLSSKGFSLIEIMMAVGLLGFSGLAVMTLTESSNKEAKWSEMNFLKSEFVSSFGKYIASSNGCKDLKDAGPFTSTSTKNLALSKWKVAGLESNPNLKMEAGREFKFFKVTRLVVGSIDYGGMNVFVPGPNGSGGIVGQKGYLTVSLTLQTKANLKRSDTSAPDRNYTYNVRVPIIVNPVTKGIIDCFENQSLQASCDAIGGTLQNGICTHPSGQCSFVKSFAIKGPNYPSNGPTGMDTCSSMAGSCTCPYPSVAISTGATYHHQSISGPSGCKGNCSGWDTYVLVIFSCLKCEPVSTSGTTGGTFGGGTFGGGTFGGGTFGGGTAGGGTAGGGGAGGTTGSCFVAGTEITLFDGSKKNIEDIRLGESLVDLKGTKVKVQKLISYDYEGPIYSINGGPYFFTPNHPFLTTSGWKSLDPKKSMEETPGLKVSHLMLGDILLKRDGVEVVLSLDSINIKDKVYNFSLDGTHEYIANEFAVHNKLPQMPGQQL